MKRIRRNTTRGEEIGAIAQTLGFQEAYSSSGGVFDFAGL